MAERGIGPATGSDEKSPATPRRRASAAIAVAVVAWATAASASFAADLPGARVVEPRAFGYAVGDVVSRRIALAVPPGFVFDDRSLPRPGGRGQALELRKVELDRRGGEPELRLEYQVFLAPREVRTLEMPAFALTFNAPSGATHSVRIDAWPLVVGPLVQVDAPTRTGLGEWRPDIAPPLVDTSAVRTRLWLWAAGLFAVTALLAHARLFAPWWAGRHRPFGTAWRHVRRLPTALATAQRQAAYRTLHEALNRTAGGVLFEAGIERWLAAQPRFAPLRDDLREFFRRSRSEFFATPPAVTAPRAPGEAGADAYADAPADPHVDPEADTRWLREFTRRCRDAELDTDMTGTPARS
jgi:mxaA protein